MNMKLTVLKHQLNIIKSFTEMEIYNLKKVYFFTLKFIPFAEFRQGGRYKSINDNKKKIIFFIIFFFQINLSLIHLR